MRALLKDKSAKSAGGGITASRGGAPNTVREDVRKARKAIELITNKRLAAVNGLLKENDSGAVVDEGGDEEQPDLNIDPNQVKEDEAIHNPKGEPDAWKFFEDDEEVVEIAVGDEGQDPEEAKRKVANDAPDARTAFLQQWIAADESCLQFDSPY